MLLERVVGNPEVVTAEVFEVKLKPLDRLNAGAEEPEIVAVELDDGPKSGNPEGDDPVILWVNEKPGADDEAGLLSAVVRGNGFLGGQYSRSDTHTGFESL